MDARKEAEYKRVRKIIETRTGNFFKVVFVGCLGYIIGGTFLTLRYFPPSKYDSFYGSIKKKFEDFVTSDEYKISQFQFSGKLPLRTPEYLKQPKNDEGNSIE